MKAGSRLPTEMVAVVRPTISKVVTPKSKGTISARMEQKHIVSKLPLEMTLTVTAFKFRPPEEPAPDRYEGGEEIFISQPVKSSTRSGLSGFYCFKIAAEKCLDVLSSTTGTYLLTFSLVRSCNNSHTKQQTQFQPHELKCLWTNYVHFQLHSQFWQFDQSGRRLSSSSKFGVDMQK